MDFFYNFYKVYRALKSWNCSGCNLFEVYPNFELKSLAYIEGIVGVAIDESYVIFLIRYNSPVILAFNLKQIAT